MSIRLREAPAIEGSAHRALVTAIRELLSRSEFDTLTELGTSLRPRRSAQRLSELARGTRLPDSNELRAVVQACSSSEWPRLQRLLSDARAERSAASQVPPPRLGDRAVTGSGARLPIVAEFQDWEQLGVHRPIALLGTGEEVVDMADRVAAGDLPSYVLREKDVEPETGLRPVLAAMASGTGPAVRLVVITGESSAGKTRAAVEAMRAELPRWRLLIPHSADRLGELLDADFDLRHVVVWLDEIQTVLEQASGLEQIRRLLALAEGPTVLLGTLRTDREAVLRGSAGWDLLDRRAHLVAMKRRPPRVELNRELARARDLDDPWITEALNRIGTRFGIAEWLAAGPQLLRALERARTSSNPVERVGAALVDAAVDCYRAGYTTSVPEPLLADAHQIYLDDPTEPTTADLFSAALTWARRSVTGAAGLLENHRGRGDRAFDYLLGHAERDHAPPVETPIWAALLRHITPYVLPSIAQAADRHGRADVADLLIARASPEDGALLEARRGDTSTLAALADAGRPYAAERFARLLAERGDINTLTARADAGDASSSMQLHRLLAERSDIETLATRADRGDRVATVQLASLLAERGEVEALTMRADRGDDKASVQIAWLLARRGNLEQLLVYAHQGDRDATWRLASLLAERGDVDALTIRADNGDEFAPAQLARLLIERGELDLLTRRADDGDREAANQLAELLVDRGDARTLTTRADQGDQHAAWQLALLLTAGGDVNTLTARSARGDHHARAQLSWLFAARGDVDALSACAAYGDPDAADRLAELLDKDEKTPRHAPPT